MIETEVKLRIGKIPDVESRLRLLGAYRESERTLEDDTLYDFPDRRLTGAGSLLRVRRRSDGARITFKGEVESGARAKVRREEETPVGDVQATLGILDGIGLEPIWRYQKYRTTYRLGNLHAVLDEAPIGNFLELEGPKPEIDRWAGALGYRPDDYLVDTYRDLYETWCAARGQEPTHMTFPETA